MKTYTVISPLGFRLEVTEPDINLGLRWALGHKQSNKGESMAMITSSAGGAKAATDQLSKMSGREKYWSELTADEKIERMRQQVKHIQGRCAECTKKLRNAQSLFQYHQHGPDGAILVSLNAERIEFETDYGGLEKRSENPDEVYF